VQPLVRGVGDPDFLFVGRHAHAVTRAAVALRDASLEPRDLDAVKLLAGRQVADFKPQQSVDVYKAERATTVDGERPDR